MKKIAIVGLNEEKAKKIFDLDDSNVEFNVSEFGIFHGEVFDEIYDFRPVELFGRLKNMFWKNYHIGDDAVVCSKEHDKELVEKVCERIKTRVDELSSVSMYYSDDSFESKLIDGDEVCRFVNQIQKEFEDVDQN